MYNIICSGFGGQGILTAGLIIANAGMNKGQNVTWIPSYGSEMRGGTANCNVKISDKKISTPFVKNIDILVAMNTPSLNKFEKMVVSGGTIVANSTMVEEGYKYRDDINVFYVDATALSDKIGNSRGANIAMLGSLAATEVLFSADVILKNVNMFFEKKGKNNPKNIETFNLGMKNTKKM